MLNSSGSRVVVTSPPTVREPESTLSPASIRFPVSSTSDTTPSPSATMVDTPGDVTDACGESDKFRITSSQAPEIEKCYQAADSGSSFDGQVYSVTGTLKAPQMFVVPSGNDDEVSPLAQHRGTKKRNCTNKADQTSFRYITGTAFGVSCYFILNTYRTTAKGRPSW